MKQKENSDDSFFLQFLKHKNIFLDTLSSYLWITFVFIAYSFFTIIFLKVAF